MPGLGSRALRILGTAAVLPDEALPSAELDERLRSAGRDHTIGRLFLETAQALAGPGEGSDPALARAIVDTVLPRYFAALEPAPAAAPRKTARATVTLVRWPYT